MTWVSRVSSGTWGLMQEAVFGLFLTPVFFYVIPGPVGAVRQPAAVAADGLSWGRGVATPVPSAASNGERGACAGGEAGCRVALTRSVTSRHPRSSQFP